GGVGSTQTPPTAEGGALRAQDLLTGADPQSYDGTVLRLDPLSGAPMADNPLVGGTTLGDDPIIAYGLRNPFRMTARPGTNEMWVGDVGWNDWEEIDRVTQTGDLSIENFGWPCYEGIGKQPGYQGTGLNLCTLLYGQPGTATDPYYTYKHSDRVVPDEACGTGSSSITGLAFYDIGSYPTSYEGALFFADYARNCIWTMPLGPDGEPDVSARFTFASAASTPVDLKIGPGGDLFYVDISGGNIYRIKYVAGTEPPIAVIDANKTDGPTPLVVQFDGSGSFDPDPGDTLAYSWDLDGNGTFGDSTAVAPTRTYSSSGTYKVKLRVTDPHGATAIAGVTITAGNTRPTASITTPTSLTTWHAGSLIGFSGSATDPQQGTLAGSALSWTLVLHHCPDNCHEHTVQTFTGASGSFTAPEHEYPTHLELRLTATDSGGLTDTKSVFLYPETVDLTLASDPPGLNLTAGPQAGVAPFVRTEIVGSSISLSAPSPQTLNGNTYTFVSWSDGGA
ncbi:MAG: PKD domain-containing protein, partial [Candidatus Binatia bacterium]